MKKLITLLALFCVFKANAQTIIVVADTTALKAYSPTTQHQLYVTDQNTAGIFQYYASGYTANGGTVFAANTSGFWVRQFSGPTNLKWFGAKGDGVTDDTNPMRLFINDSYCNKHIPCGTYMLNATHSFNIQSNTSLVIDNNAKLQVITNSTGYILFYLHTVDNVRITGGALIGERGTHSGSSLGYGVNMDGATNCSIFNMNINNFYGDGVYVGGGLCNNININQIISNHNARQGMSITNATNVYVGNSSFINTDSLPPKSGIDIEPNLGNTIANITIENVTASGNSGEGISTSGAGSSIPIKNLKLINIISNSNKDDGIALQGGATSYIQGIDIINLKADSNHNIGAFVSKANNVNMSHVFINESSGVSNLYFEKMVKGSIDQFSLTSSGSGVMGIYLGVGNTGFNISQGSINTKNTLINIAASASLSNSSISYITGTDSTADGFTLWNMTNSTISNNSISNVGQSGLNFLNGSSNTVVGNIITGAGMITTNTYSGIRLQGTASKFTVQANQIFNGSNTNSIKWGIECDGATTGNQVINNYLLGAGITAPTVDVGTLNVFYNPLVATANNQVAIANGTGGYIPTTVSGDVTNAAGAFTVGTNKITYAKMQAMTANKLLGSGLSGTAVSEITLGTGLSMTGSTLNVSGAAADAFVSVSDANYSISATETYYTLSAITANRTLTMAGTAGLTGRILKIQNTYTSASPNWSFAGTAVKDVTGTTISTLAPTTLYILEYNGTNWIKIN